MKKYKKFIVKFLTNSHWIRWNTVNYSPTRKIFLTIHICCSTLYLIWNVSKSCVVWCNNIAKVDRKVSYKFTLKLRVQSYRLRMRQHTNDYASTHCESPRVAIRVIAQKITIEVVSADQVRACYTKSLCTALDHNHIITVRITMAQVMRHCMVHCADTLYFKVASVAKATARDVPIQWFSHLI